MAPPAPQPQLKRSLGLALLTFYGLGNILGAGIYVLIGKVVGVAGMYAPLAFMTAALIAALSALSYGELSARLPLSAGEAVYLEHAFGKRWLTVTTGVLVAFAGMVSAATISRGFAGYLQVYIAVPDPLAIIVLIGVLGALAAWGITQSVRVAALFTLLEIGGLLLVVIVGGGSLAALPERLPELLPPLQPAAWQGVLLGAFLAFYAYIGFEDMVNVAEEVHSPQRNLPLAIMLALLISTALYILVALVATLSVPAQQLAASDAPLALIYQHVTGRDPVVITQVALFAVINGALIQIIMAARIFYGMSHQGWLPPLLSRVHPRTQTPVIATLLVASLVALMALWLPLVALAKLTSFIVLLVFALINASLLRIKQLDPEPHGIRTIPAWIPLLALLCTVALSLAELLSYRH